MTREELQRWRENSGAMLDDVRREIEAASEPVVCVVMMAHESDLLGDRPVSFFANVSDDAMRAMLRYCAMRLDARAEVTERTAMGHDPSAQDKRGAA